MVKNSPQGAAKLVVPYHSKQFGKTPPPSDGSIAPCPACVNGQQRIGLIHSIGCPDCLGSGVRGYGHTAIAVFDEWVENLPSDGGEGAVTPDA
jgi:hypothetical protein